MSYIRAKEIPPRSGNWYDYEVRGIREGSKVRQKVIRYIGKSGLRASRSSISGVGITNHPPIAIKAGESLKHNEPVTPIENKARIAKMKTPSSQIASA